MIRKKPKYKRGDLLVNEVNQLLIILGYDSSTEDYEYLFCPTGTCHFMAYEQTDFATRKVKEEKHG